MNGFLLLDKETGFTSFDVIKAVRRLSGVKKVGHCGTLDPLASGLMVVALGEATKFLEYLIGLDKEYEVLAHFGAFSDSYDADGVISSSGSEEVILEDKISEVISEKFLGKISQFPPRYSALKVGGRRACDIVRAGGDVDLKARNVNIKSFEMMKYNWPKVSFRVSCGSGTYIRSLINDLGESLGCGAYVLELKRTKVGEFLLSDAVRIELLDNKVDQYLISLEEFMLRYPFLFNVISLSDVEFEALKDGRVLLSKKVDPDMICVAFYNDKVVGIIKNDSGGLGIKYAKVINCDKFS